MRLSVFSLVSTVVFTTILLAASLTAPAWAGAKVLVCHQPPGNPSNRHEISVAAAGAKAHLANHPGDRLGKCRTETDPAAAIIAATQISKDEVDEQMEIAAELAGVTIDPNGLAIAQRDDVLAIMAPIPDPLLPTSADSAVPLFAFFDFPTHACSETLPTDFYTIEVDPAAGEGFSLASFRNLEGSVVTELPVFLRPAAENVTALVVGLSLDTVGKGVLQGHVHKCCPPSEFHAIPMLNLLNADCLDEIVVP
jgi:hypothetical protein